jgi:hypothetical protein
MADSIPGLQLRMNFPDLPPAPKLRSNGGIELHNKRKLKDSCTYRLSM